METVLSAMKPVSTMAPSNDGTSGNSGTDLTDDVLRFHFLDTDETYLNIKYVPITPIEPVTPFMHTFTFEHGRTIVPYYTRLNEMLMVLQVSLVKKNKDNNTYEAVLLSDNAAPLPYLQDTIWSNVDIELNGTKIAGGSNNYRHITAYTNRLLGINAAAHATYTSLELGYPKDGLIDPDTTQTLNTGHKERVSQFAAAQRTDAPPKVLVVGPLSSDASTLDGPLLNNVHIKVTCTRAKPEQLIVTGPTGAVKLKEGSQTETEPVPYTGGDASEYELLIHSAILVLPKPMYEEKLYMHHTKLLAQGHPAVYYMNKTVSKWVAIPSGTQTFFSHPLYPSGALPYKLLVMFYEQNRLLGDFNQSLVAFRRPDALKYANLELDGTPCTFFDISSANTLNSGLDRLLYLNLFLSTETYFAPNPPKISFETFKKHNFILSYDLTCGHSLPRNKLPMMRDGDLKLHLEFDTPTTTVLNALVFGSSPSLMTCDMDRIVNISNRG